MTEVSGLFEDMASSKEIHLKLDLDEGLYLFVDRNATSTIFRNLINNAIKFTETGGTIEIKGYKDNSLNKAVVQVIDNGVGIPDSKIKQLFDLNEHVSTKGTSGESGIGLGLQLVYDFVKLNKGTIDVVSKEGKGTTFTVILPSAN